MRNIYLTHRKTKKTNFKGIWRKPSVLFLCQKKRGEQNVRNFDEINTLSQDEMLSIEDYFDGMELTEEEKEERKKFAYNMQDVMLFIFALFLTMREYDYMNKQYIVGQLQSRYSEIVLQYMDIDKYLEDYITDFSQETVDTTLKHIDEEFYLSEDRSFLISVNEANGIFNYQEFSEAIKQGKTRKQWITERDNRVRKTHAEINGITIPINDYFIVGESLMLFPKDTSYGASMEEIAGCRCTIKYF